MSEQSKILEQMQEIIMKILQSGTATVEEGDRLDELEEMLFKQKCFESLNNSEHSCKGEEIATLFFKNEKEKAISKLYEFEITPEDFFGFAEYHYDEDDSTDMFTESFVIEVTKTYQDKCQSK